MLKKLLSHTVLYGISPHVSKIASIFILPIITKYLTELDYGVFGTITAYQTALSVLSTIGLRVVLVNSYFKSPSQFKWLWRQVYGFLIQWSIVFAFLSAVILYFIIPPEARQNEFKIICLSVFPLVLFGPVNLIGFNFYQLRQEPIQIAIRTICSGLITVFLNLYFIAILKMGYMGWIWSTCIVSILLNLSYLFPVLITHQLTPIFNYKKGTILNSLRISLPLVPHYYSGFLLESSDKVVMDNLGVGTPSIGKYNVAYTVARVVSSLGNALGLAIGPLLNNFYKQNDYIKARNLIVTSQKLMLLLTAGLALWLKEIFMFLINNDQLAETYDVGIVLVMSYAYRPMYLGASARLMFEEKTTWMPRLTFTAGAFNVFLNLLLIPIFGFEVAAITTFISYMLMGYGFYFVRTVRELLVVNYYPIFMFLVTCLLTIGVFYARDLKVEFKLVISLFVLLCISFFISNPKALKMSMDREKIIDFLNANYVSVFINHPILGKIDLWPLIRVQLYSQLIKNLENLSTSKDERKSTIFEKIVSIPSRLRSIAECFFIKKNERLLLGANSHRVDHEGSSFNRFFDPELTKNGLLLEYAGKRDVNYYSKTIELFEVLPIWSFFSGYNKYSIKEAELFKLRCLLDVVSKRFGCPFLNFESTILTSLRTIGKWENLFTFLLKKSRAQEVVALCYYSNPVFGAFLAASRIGVKKVDLQHGPQTSTHGAYGKWKYIFKNHNYLMPNEFWTWDESSAKTINDFTLNPEYHRSVVYGNDWIKYWKNKNSKMAIPNSLYLLSLQPLETPIPSDFLNFMAKTAGDGVFWWIRFHPRQTLLDYAFVKELLINHITNDESFFLDKGNEFPLPEILKNTSVHFTCFSGTALEAAEFNIPTYFLDSRACDLIVQRPKLFFWFRDFKIGWEKFEVE